MTIPEIKKEQEDKMSILFKECGVFFAFSKSQFDENKTPLKEGEKYVSIGGGGFLPKGNASSFTQGMNDIETWFKAAIKSNNARKKHIEYELSNHEAYYTHDIDSTVDALGEGYTREEIQRVFNKTLKQNTQY